MNINACDRGDIIRNDIRCKVHNTNELSKVLVIDALRIVIAFRHCHCICTCSSKQACLMFLPAAQYIKTVSWLVFLETIWCSEGRHTLMPHIFCLHIFPKLFQAWVLGSKPHFIRGIVTETPTLPAEG